MYNCPLFQFQIGLYDPAEADLEHFWICCSEGFLGERLYVAVVGRYRRSRKNLARQLLHHSYKSASATP